MSLRQVSLGGRLRGGILGWIAAASLILALLLAPVPRAAATGELTYRGCLNGDGSSNCVDLPGSPLDGAGGVALSPSGNSVYVASTAGSISHFFRGGAGQLGYDGCLNNDGSSNCFDLSGGPLAGAQGVAVSPDGGSVYVISGSSWSITHFFRAPTGQINYGGCIDNTGSSGCLDLPGTPFERPESLAISPDGDSVDVASFSSSSVTRFLRFPAGQLVFGTCLNDDGSSGCIDVPDTPLTYASSVAVSPDSGSVYVASFGAGSITKLAGAGLISFDSCLSYDGSSGCGSAGLSLATAQAVALSPDGTSVYVGTFLGSIAQLSRAAGGGLSFEGCFNPDGSAGCADLPGTPLQGASSIAVSPDGRSVYVASTGSDSLARFTRTGGGPLTYDGCFNDDGSSGCADLPGAPLDYAKSVAVSPDGNSVYVASVLGDTLARFSRKLAPPRTRIDSAGIDRRANKAIFKFTSNQPGSTFECKLDRRPFRKCISPKSYPHLGGGGHTFRVRAANSQKTVDATPAKKKFEI